ncbi:MAG: hypothetical protein KGI28_07790 [Thaumarchaeota archaeon]|nr:hypothetical protein [Nitrososphaerota archaeon]
MNFTISKPNFSSADLARVDKRFLQFITGWSISETYDGNTVIIPDIIPFNYFEVTDKPVDDIKDNEKEVSLWCGWARRSNGKDIDGLYDAEVIINLRIDGADALNEDPNVQVKAEILKSGGAPITVSWNNKLVTDFTSVIPVTCPGSWFSPGTSQNVIVTNGYQTRIMNSFI